MIRTLRHTLLLVAFTSVISSCSTTKTDGLDETEKPGSSPGLSGVWKSDGYGFVFVSNGDTLQAFEVTQTTCVPSLKLTRRAEVPAGVEGVRRGERQPLCDHVTWR